MKYYQDITGKKYNKLTPVYQIKRTSRYRYWVCDCDCGKKTTVLFHEIVSGGTKSCGCIRRKIGSNKKNEKNTMWAGDEVGYTALHNWVRRRLKKPEICQKCMERQVLDLANISNEYQRDLSDWEWLCRKCHMWGDGRLKNLKQYN